MKAWMAAWAGILALAVAACGISDGGSGGTVPKTDEDLAIRDIEVASLTDTTATLRWSTTVQAVGTLFYGQGVSATLPFTKASPLGTRHEIALAQLTEDTEYRYQILAADGFGKSVTSAEAVFRTLPAADRNDTSPPVIRNIRATGVTPASVTITWETDDRTIGQVLYGTSPSALTEAAATPSGDYRRQHALIVSGLEQTTTYHFAVLAKNRANLETLSPTSSFATTSYPTLYIHPETLSLSVGETGTFEVRIEGAENVAGLSFYLTYPSSAIQVLGVSEGSFFTSGGHVFLLGEPDLDPVAADATWLIEYADGVPVGARSGREGVVARITCRGRGLEENGRLRFRLLPLDAGNGEEYDPFNPENETRLLDHNRNVIPVNVRNANLIVD